MRLVLVVLKAGAVLALIGAASPAPAASAYTGSLSLSAAHVEISGDCGSTRRVTVEGDVNNGMTQSSAQIETSVSFSQAGEVIATAGPEVTPMPAPAQGNPGIALRSRSRSSCHQISAASFS